MKTNLKTLQVIKKGVLTTLLWLGTLFGMLFIVTFFALQIPLVQTKVARALTDLLHEKTGHDIKIGYVNISWFDSMVLDQVEVKDSFDSTMIVSETVVVDFSLLDLITQSNYPVDAVQVKNSGLYLQKVNDSTALNITHFLRSIKKLRKPRAPGTAATPFAIGKIKLEDAIITINDQRKGPAPSPWDYNHMRFENLDCTISDLTIKSDTVEAIINRLSADDAAGDLNIQSMSGHLFFNNHLLRFDELDLQTDRSRLTDAIAFHYSDPAMMSYFIDSVEMDINFDQSLIHPGDVQLFSPKPIPFNQPIHISGHFKGKVGRFDLDNLVLRVGRQSRLEGFLSMNGLPNLQETFIDIRLKNSLLDGNDLKNFSPEEAHPFLDSLSYVRAKGSFLGFYTDFVANATFTSEVGVLNSNLNLKLPHRRSVGSYSGSLDLQSFDLGQFLGEENLGRVTLKGSIAGKGFTRDNADFFLNAALDSLDYRGYPYSGISTNAKFAAGFFQGHLEINDPNLKFNIDGTVDLRDNRDKVDFRGRLDTLKAKALKLSSRDIILHTNVDLDFYGLELDNLVGLADFQDFYFSHEGKHVNLDTISIIATHNYNQRELLIDTDLAEFRASGNYDYTTLSRDLKQLWKEYKATLFSEEDSLQLVAQDSLNLDPYQVDLQLQMHDANPYINLFTDRITIAKNADLSGTFSHGNTSILHLSSHLDTLRIDDYEFIENQFDMNSSIMNKTNSILGMLFLSSEEQHLKKATSFENFHFEAIWNENKVDFSTNLKQTNTENRANLFGEVQIHPDQYRLHVKPSQFTAVGREWHFSTDNEIIYDQGDITFNHFQVQHEDQYILLSGVSSNDPKEELALEISNFRLDNINPIVNASMDGVLNTKAQITGRGEDLLVQSELKIDELQLNDFLVGNVSGTSNWENAYRRLRLGFEVVRLDRKVIQLGGYFYPKEKTQLDMVANFNGTSLKVAEPFIANQRFSQLDGSLTGQFTIGGTVRKPVLQGEGSISEGQVLVNYLNTLYTFNGDVIFKEDEIGVRDLDIRDVNNNSALASGGILHDGFRNFEIDFQAKMKNFQVLNTNSTDNSLYYGTANLSGDISFEGPFTNLQISAEATTKKGTRIFIPLTNTSNVVQEDFIQFVNLSEQKSPGEEEEVEEVEPLIDLKGMKLDFDLDITPDAYTELIFDIKSGDIIRGRGNGKINLQINTDGDFLMFGDFVITNGGYNFTLKNIINKEFDLIEGSKISWYGDPYQGVMDITAEYNQLTSLLPLLTENPTEELMDSPDARRKYPVVVVLDLEGPLLTPEIDFDIRITDYPENIAGYSVGPMVNAFDSRISSDEQELKRQVFSLIVLKRFSPQNSFNVSGGQTLGSSVSEFISNQLSYWVSQVDENLEIDVDLTSLDQDAFNTFQLRLAYTFLDGRLKVSRDGGFTNLENETDISTVVGDWTVEYLITSDGKLRAKMYNKTNYNAVNQGLNNPNNTTAGFSLQYTRSFDQFRELLFKARKLPKIPIEEQKPEDKEENVISSDALSSENEPPRKLQ